MILSGVQKFSAMMEATDKMAVVCVLSHGANGYIYGSDGNLVSLRQLVDCLNNVNCPSMVDKPKLIVVQACQTGAPYILIIMAHVYE